jgi:hypothetical protein
MKNKGQAKQVPIAIRRFNSSALIPLPKQKDVGIVLVDKQEISATAMRGNKESWLKNANHRVPGLTGCDPG